MATILSATYLSRGSDRDLVMQHRLSLVPVSSNHRHKLCLAWGCVEPCSHYWLISQIPYTVLLSIQWSFYLSGFWTYKYTSGSFTSKGKVIIWFCVGKLHNGRPAGKYRQSQTEVLTQTKAMVYSLSNILPHCVLTAWLKFKQITVNEQLQVGRA